MFCFVFTPPKVLSCFSYVDIGDQGVNDARWFENEAILVTASGTGRWAFYPVNDVLLVYHVTDLSYCFWSL